MAELNDIKFDIGRYVDITTTTTDLRPFFRDHPGEPVPEENFRTLWCKRRLTGADTLTIRLGATPSGLTSAHLDITKPAQKNENILYSANCTMTVITN